jgi:hypothetical protein
MLNHISIRVASLNYAKAFYDATFSALGHQRKQQQTSELNSAHRRHQIEEKTV